MRKLCFLRDYYGDSLDVMFPQFPNHFLPFPMVFPHVSPSVSTVSPQCPPTPPHPHPPIPILDFAIKL